MSRLRKRQGGYTLGRDAFGLVQLVALADLAHLGMLAPILEQPGPGFIPEIIVVNPQSAALLGADVVVALGLAARGRSPGTRRRTTGIVPADQFVDDGVGVGPGEPLAASRPGPCRARRRRRRVAAEAALGMAMRRFNMVGFPCVMKNVVILGTGTLTPPPATMPVGASGGGRRGPGGAGVPHPTRG